MINMLLIKNEMIGIQARDVGENVENNKNRLFVIL